MSCNKNTLNSNICIIVINLRALFELRKLIIEKRRIE